MRLANSSNVCYLNAFFTAWMWSSWTIQHPALQVHEQARQGVLALLEARHPIHVLGHPVWSALLHEWQDPHSQHDVAEFALFAAAALPIACMQLRWQSRVATDTGVERAVTCSFIHIQCTLLAEWFSYIHAVVPSSGTPVQDGFSSLRECSQ